LHQALAFFGLLRVPWINALRDELAGFVGKHASLFQTDSRIGAHREIMLLPTVSVPKAKEL
jgi:hypothetical protein